MNLLATTLILIVSVCLSFHSIDSKKISKRQASTCQIKGQTCSSETPCVIDSETKTLTCGCSLFGFPDCTVTLKTVRRQQRCYNRRERRYYEEGSTWEIQSENRTLDCSCRRRGRDGPMVIACSGENRCHYKGVSYVSGNRWNSSDVTGLALSCHCHGNERVTCRGSASTETPRPENDAQWVEDHVVYGSEILRPRIATLQACDTGDRVVSSGYRWNQTTSVSRKRYTVQQCECRDALIQCQPYHFSRSQVPHCLTDDGEVKRVGEKWIKVHHSHSNIRWDCYCRSNGRKSCKDIGYCKDPTPPPNGAMVCVTKGPEGPKQWMFCKALCRGGYDFFNRQRYYRQWEVCSTVTHHRWSGGYAADGLLLAKCRRPTWRTRGRDSLYYRNGSCRDLRHEEINSIKIEFIRSLTHEYLCSTKNPRETCSVKWFKCGEEV